MRCRHCAAEEYYHRKVCGRCVDCGKAAYRDYVRCRRCLEKRAEMMQALRARRAKPTQDWRRA